MVFKRFQKQIHIQGSTFRDGHERREQKFVYLMITLFISSSSGEGISVWIIELVDLEIIYSAFSGLY